MFQICRYEEVFWKKLIGSPHYLKPLAYTPDESEEIRWGKEKQIQHLHWKSDRACMSWRINTLRASSWSMQCGWLQSSCFKNTRISWTCHGLLGWRSGFPLFCFTHNLLQLGAGYHLGHQCGGGEGRGEYRDGLPKVGAHRDILHGHLHPDHGNSVCRDDPAQIDDPQPHCGNHKQDLQCSWTKPSE